MKNQQLSLTGLFLAVLCLPVPSGGAPLSVTLTVQEALYRGGSTGVARTNEPFCVGVPLADSAGITSTGVLGLTGATTGQFRVLGTWPDGHYKWVKVCGVLPSLSAGGTASVTLTSTGGGNFGGSNLATDNGSTITVATGTATFVIKKANFNVLDSVVVGSTTLVASSSSATRGLVITGPSPTATYPANVTCGIGTCTTLYSSANDPNSSCSIEENGPVMAVIKCTGNHEDSSGHAYMQYTARECFYKNTSSVKVTSILRNANYTTSATPSPDAGGSTFDTAYKGFQAYELRIAPSITGTLSYTIATDSSPQTGTLNQVSGTDTAYIYQGQSNGWDGAGEEVCAYQSACANSYTTDTGFRVVKNGVNQVTGAATQFPQGWADVSDSNGNGVEIGVYQMAAYYPKSLEFDAGGADVRIGIFPGENSKPVYQAWPAWSIHDLFLEFHAGAPASLANEFLKFQHYLVARATPVPYYNATGVFPYNIVDPTIEDNYLSGLASSAVPSIGLNKFCYNGLTPCAPDRSLGVAQDLGNALNLGVYRNYAWFTGGPLNQEEFRWSDLLRFLQRGQTGRYLNSMHFYRFQAEKVWPHADGTSATDSTVNHFAWRSRPQATQSGAELDNLGRPAVACAGDNPCSTLTNSSQSFVNWFDTLHNHWYGMLDYYFMTGDETIHEAIIPLEDWYLNPHTYQGPFSATNGLANTRALGIELMSASRFSTFLAATGDATDASSVLAEAAANWTDFIEPDPCVRPGPYPAGCSPPPIASGFGANDPSGVSKVRGMHQANSARGQGWCPAASGSNYYRIQQPFEQSILEEGLLSLITAEGPSWPDYEVARDTLYGMAQWALTEGFSDDGQAHWMGSDARYNGFRYEVWTDFANVCTGTPTGAVTTIGGVTYDNNSLANADQGMWLSFYVLHLIKGTVSDWQRQFNIALDQAAYHQSIYPADFGSYEIGALIDIINNPGNYNLQDVTITSVDNLGSGNYTLHWTEPAGVTSYRVKWSNKIIAPSNALLNFDPINTYTYSIDPATHMTWFGANTVNNEPAPGAGGQARSITISTGTLGLTIPNFSVKAYVGSTGSTPPPPPPDTTPPTVSVTAPANGATVTGTVTVSASASDDVAMASVQFKLDGANLGSLVTGPGPSYTVSWDTTKVANGSHTLAAIATDQAGNTATSSISITVANQSTGGTLNIPVNTWVVVQPTYVDAPNGGQTWFMGWNNKAAYDPVTQRVLFWDRWYDNIRNGSIYANGVFAYDPVKNVVTILKLNNWTNAQVTCSNGSPGCQETEPLPANTTDPTPPDRHILGSVELVPTQNALYIANGLNASLPNQSLLNGTWKLDLGTNTWTNVSSQPPNGGGAPGEMVYDSVKDVLVYLLPQPNIPSVTTYLFNATANTWSAVAQDASASGLNVSSAGVTYDSKRDLVMLFGGGNNATSQGSSQLYSYSVGQNKWKKLASAPVGTLAPGFAYDPTHDIFIALIGDNTYLYDPNLDAWKQIQATLNRPSAIQNWQSITYDPAQDVFVFEGGTWNSPLMALFRYQAGGTGTGTPPPPDTTPPTVSMNAPANGATVTGTVTASANATDDVGVAGVQFTLDSVNLGSLVTGAGPSYSVSWDTATAANGSHTLDAIATDQAGNAATSSISVTVSNSVTPPPVGPTISGVTASAITSSTASVTWTTDMHSDSQVAYGTTSAYGSLSPLDTTPTTSHLVNLSGLAASTTYHYQVRSRNAQGNLATSGDFTFSTAADPPAGASGFVPVSPCRVADTRNPDGPFGGPSLASQTSRDFVIPDSACGIPPTATAYSLNVAVVPTGALGYLTVWPTGQPQPLVATLNSDGRVKSNAAIVPAGTNGAISVFATDTTDVVLDINGYFMPKTDTAALAFYPVTPCRIADTRNAVGPLGGPSLVGQQSRTFPILTSTCNIPTTAQAYSLNFAAVPSGPLGYLTAWPTGQSQPLVASLNAPTGAITANAVVVPAGTNGDVDVFATNNTDLVIDVDGYFAPAGPDGLSLYVLAPCRLLDTRLPSGAPPFSGTLNVNVTASPCGVPSAAQAYVFNATVVPPAPLGYITLWPEGESQPLAATLNASDGAITSNMALVPTTNGSISVFASNPTHLVLDTFGYFAP